MGAGEHRWLKGRERGKGGTLCGGGAGGASQLGRGYSGVGRSVLKVCADIGTPSTPVRPVRASEVEARVSRNQRHVFRDAVV